MAKFSECSDEIKELVNDIANELGLITYGVDFQPLCVDKAKKPVQLVRANKLAEYASNREDLIFVLVYEDAFDALGASADPEKQKEINQKKYLWLRMEMDTVSYDTEKDKLVIGCPSITLPVGFCETYKEAAVNAALLGQYTIAQIEQKKKEEEAQRKALKTKRK